MRTPHVLSGGRYPVLRALAILYLLGAALAVLAGLVTIIYVFARGPGDVLDRTIISLGALIGTFVVVLSMLALAELLKLFIDVEHNTRMSGSAHVTTVAATAGGAVIATEGDGHASRIDNLSEESAEAALLRGH